MIEITIRRDGAPSQTVRLDDGAHGIGRHDSNPVHLDDAEVSRKHARLLIDGDTVIIEDLGSNNGTLVGGEEVTRTVLAAGVEAEITPFFLSWRDPAAAAPAMVVLEGNQKGQRFPLVDEALSIGRGEDQDIALDDQGASRSHAILVKNDGQWMIRDTGSANGLFINERESRDAILHSGDTVQIGNTVLRFEDPNAPAPAADGFDPEEAAPTEVYTDIAEDMPTDVQTRGSDAETALAMPSAPEPVMPPPVAEAAPADPGNMGLVALVISVIAVVLVLVGLLAMAGSPA